MTCLKRFIKGQTVKRGSKLIQSIFHKTRKIIYARIALMMKVIWIWMKKFKVAWSEELIWRNLTVAKACKCWCLAKHPCIWYTLLSYREPLPYYWPFYSLIWWWTLPKLVGNGRWEGGSDGWSPQLISGGQHGGTTLSHWSHINHSQWEQNHSKTSFYSSY